MRQKTLLWALTALLVAAGCGDDSGDDGAANAGAGGSSAGKGGSGGSAAGSGGSSQAGKAGSAQAGSSQGGKGGSAQAGGGGSSQAGQGGSAQAGQGGSSQAGGGGSSQAGQGGSSQAGQGGSSQAGQGGSEQAGQGGSSQAGSGGSSQAGQGGSEQAGSAGSEQGGQGGSGGSSAGSGGQGGSSGKGGSGGQGGSAGSGGKGGSGGSAAGAGGKGGSAQAGSGGSSAGSGGSSAGSAGAAGAPDDGPPAGNPDGTCAVPAEAQAEDTSKPDHVVGDGTKASCTGDAVVKAVAKGGIITFNCGPDPVTITLAETAKIFNNTGPKIVIDGGGKVTLSGGGKKRILYQDTCDQKQVWTTDHCQNQDHPQLTVQNLTFTDGNSTGQLEEGGGGGAILVRGGRFKIVNSRFFRNQCDKTGPDLGGAAVRVLSQYNGEPVYVVHSTFGGTDALGNSCSNGGALSSIGVSYTVLNTLMSYNHAIGNGANPAKPDTPGGGSGGAIYNDGNTYTLHLCGDKLTNNTANEGGGAIFFVSNSQTGSLIIDDSFLSKNPSKGFETPGYPGIFVFTKDKPQVTNSTIE